MEKILVIENTFDFPQLSQRKLEVGKSLNGLFMMEKFKNLIKMDLFVLLINLMKCLLMLTKIYGLIMKAKKLEKWILLN